MSGTFLEMVDDKGKYMNLY